MRRVGCMVAHDAVDAAVAQGLLQCQHVLVRAQRRVHLVVGVVIVGDVVLAEEQVVRAHLAADLDAALAAAHDHVNGLGRGDVGDVQGAARKLREKNVATDLDFLALGGPTGQAQAARDDALVHDALAHD